MVGYINYEGIGSSKSTGGIETYYKNKLKKSSNYLFFTKENSNEFDRKNFLTELYLLFFRRNIKNIFIRNHFDWYFQLYFALKKIKKSFDYIEVADSFGYGIVLHLLNIPYIVKIHTPHSVVCELNNWKKDKYYRIIKFIEKKAIRYAKKIESPSRAMIDYLLLHNWKIDILKTVIIKNAFYSNNTSKILKKENQILFVGNLEPRKNLIFLLNAFVNNKIFENYKLIICGSDSFIYDKNSKTNNSYWSYCKKVCPKILNNSRILYKGFIDNNEIEKYYKSSEFFVICSTGFENFPTVVLEAISNNAIVIGCDIGGIREIITDSKNGFLFKDNDKSDFIATFKQAINCNRKEILNSAIKELQKINKQIEVPYGNFKKS